MREAFSSKRTQLVRKQTQMSKTHWELTFAFCTRRPLFSSFMPTVDVNTSVPLQDWYWLEWSSYNHHHTDVSNRKEEEALLFSVASPLFFKISAIVTTVAIAAHIHVNIFAEYYISFGLGVEIDEAGNISFVQLMEDVISVWQNVCKLTHIFSVLVSSKIK